MAWSSGTFSRTNGTYSGATVWATDEANAFDIESTRHDTHDQDLATGINSCIHKGGQNAATADLPMGGFKHSNVGNATALTHYAVVGQSQNGSYHWGGTSSGSSGTYAITCTPAPTAYAAGQIFRFIANHTNSGAATLNVNSLGAKNIKAHGGTLALNGMRGALYINSVIEVLYDGTQFCILNPRYLINPYAAAGTTQGTATAIDTPFAYVTSVSAGSADGVRLPDSATPGFSVYISNTGGNTLKVYPASGDQIDGNATNNPETFGDGIAKTFVCYSTGPIVWYPMY